MVKTLSDDMFSHFNAQTCILYAHIQFHMNMFERKICIFKRRYIGNACDMVVLI